MQRKCLIGFEVLLLLFLDKFFANEDFGEKKNKISADKLMLPTCLNRKA